LVPYLLIVQSWRPISDPSTSFGQTGFEGSQLESLHGYLSIEDERFEKKILCHWKAFFLNLGMVGSSADGWRV
jgi:hypothetical protein